MKPHRGTLILVFGILGLVACAAFGIPAWIMGNNDLREMDAGLMDPSGRDSTSAGRICGMIATIIMGVVLVGMMAFFLFFGLVGAAASAGAH